MVRKFLGIVMFLFGSSGILVSVFGARMGYQVIEDVGINLVSSLDLLSESLDSAEDSLLLAKATLVDVSAGINTLEITTMDLGTAIDETQPLLTQISKIASEDIPDSLDTVQDSLPSVVQVAGVVDDTLTTLNNFRIDERILGFTIKYDLGIDYNPTVPFDESVAQIGRSLEGLPQSLRALKDEVEVADRNLDTMSGDVLHVAEDLASLHERINELDPLLDEYLRIVIRVNDATRQVRIQLSGQLENAKRMLTFFTIWLALTQIAPLYLGWELSLGRRLR